MIFEGLILLTSYLIVGCEKSIGANIKQQNDVVCSNEDKKFNCNDDKCIKKNIKDTCIEKGAIFSAVAEQKTNANTLNYILNTKMKEGDKCYFYEERSVPRFELLLENLQKKNFITTYKIIRGNNEKYYRKYEIQINEKKYNIKRIASASLRICNDKNSEN